MAVSRVMRYETVIVGAGSAGAVLAARLSEDPARSVCLVEAGPDYLQLDQLPPTVLGFDFTDRPYAGRRTLSHEWQYTARATDHSPNMPVPRGRMVGGSSSINGVVFLRALRQDLAGWAASGNPEWSYENCLPYYRKLETECDFPDIECHGSDGPIPVQRAARENWLAPSEAFFEACTALGARSAADFNAPDARGVGPIPTNYHDGIRHSSAIGYLMPSRPRPNLEVFGDTLAISVRIDNARATGVRVAHNGLAEDLEADEVILCAGAIGSPQLLMLSGIGPAEDLRQVGIDPSVDLAGVGQHVRDHPFVATLWDTTQPGARDRLTDLPWQLMLRTQVGQPDDGWLTMILSTARDPDGGRGFMIPSSLMYAHSTGSLRLASADPLQPPLLDFNYLSDPADLEHLRSLARLALEIGQHRAFDGIRAGLRQPTSDVLASDASFDDWIMRTISTGHHISCTCRMGPPSDPAAVVDQQGRVYGVDNLRVIDASIMPDCPSVNLNATVLMMAEKLADSYSKSPTASATRSMRSIPVK
jgi:predicted dehydrogenase (TIGR03970 family)